MDEEKLRLLKDRIVEELLRTEYQQQKINKPEIFKQEEAGVIFGMDGIGYKAPVGSGMMKGIIDPDNLRVRWNNQNNNVDFKFRTNGDASFNWNGTF